MLKSLLIAIIVFLCLATHAQAQTCTIDGQVPVWTNATKWTCATPAPGALPAGSSLNMTIANAGATGTTVNRLAKLTGAPSTAVITATTDVDGALGICTSNCGTTGSATVAIIGQVTCDFDGATTAGNYVIISVVTAGMCHDGGSAFPTANAAYGRVLSTNGGAGAYVMELMTPDIAFQNAGNGKSKPGGSNTQVQFNDSGVFGGSTQFTWNKTTQKINIGGSGAANGSLTIQDNTARSLDLGWNGFAQVITANGLEMDLAGGDIYMYTGGGPSQRWRFSSTGMFIPSGSNGGFDIGDSTHTVGNLFMYRQITFQNINSATASEPFISHARTWNNGAVTFQNFLSNITDSASAAASTLIDLQVGSATKFNVRKDGLTTGQAFATLTNCSDSAGAAACGSASAGSVVIDAAATTVVVSTTAVTANSQIFVQEDSSLGTRLSVTCNTQSSLVLGALRVTARTAATSFTITLEAAPTTNPLCLSYFIVN